MFRRLALFFQMFEIPVAFVHQLTWLQRLQGMQHVAGDLLVFPGQIMDQLFDPLARQVLLRAAQVAGDDGECYQFREFGDVLLLALGQRADNDVVLVVGQQFGRHGFDLAVVEDRHHQALDQVIAVMAQGNLGVAVLCRIGIDAAAAQA